MSLRKLVNPINPHSHSHSLKADHPNNRHKPPMYLPIWNRIKQHGVCVIEVPTVVAARVKKGVIRTKDKDKGFKVLNEYDKGYLEIKVESAGTGITRIYFTMKQRIGLEPLVGVGYNGNEKEDRRK